MEVLFRSDGLGRIGKEKIRGTAHVGYYYLGQTEMFWTLDVQGRDSSYIGSKN